jgi:hypothetical protein
MTLPDWYIAEIEDLLLRVRTNLAALEAGAFRIGEFRPGEAIHDTTDQAMERDRRAIAAYEWILARHKADEPI